MQETREEGIRLPELQEHISRQKAFFQTGRTLDYTFRREALARLHQAISAAEEEIAQALYADLGKSEQEAYLTETGMVLREISHTRKKLRSWVKPRRTWPDLVLLPAQGCICPEPLGLVLILAPWNYPLHLSLIPLVNALAAGNCCLLKPSSRAPATSHLIVRLLAKVFDPGHVLALSGSSALGEALLYQHFDCIFYTGSAKVGNKILAAAAPRLIPTWLELGGKSPVIVCEDADLGLAAKRIAWGKTLNAGQTCVAPDYVLAHASVRKDLVELLQQRFALFPGPNALHNPDYGRIVSKEALARLEALGLGRAVADQQTLRMQPLILSPEDGLRPDSLVMQEEIFGPILPVFDFHDPKDALHFIRQGEKPLACYVFAGSKPQAQRLLDGLSCGGGCINDVVLQVSSHSLPFGGVGNSGMGRYHGKAGFELFSNMKSVVRGSCCFDPPWRYLPVNKRLFSFIKRILR